MLPQRRTYAQVVARGIDSQRSLLSLPSELTSRVCEQLNREELSSTRLANKYLAEVGARHFPTIVCLDLTFKSINNFKKLCQDPRLALIRDSVKEVHVITGLASNLLKSFESFYRYMRHQYNEYRSIAEDIETSCHTEGRSFESLSQELYGILHSHSEEAYKILADQEILCDIRENVRSLKNLAAIAQAMWPQRHLFDCMNVPDPVRQYSRSIEKAWTLDGFERKCLPPKSAILTFFLRRLFYSPHCDRNSGQLIVNPAYCASRLIPLADIVTLERLEWQAAINGLREEKDRSLDSNADMAGRALYHLRSIKIDLLRPAKLMGQDVSSFWSRALSHAVNLKCLYLWLPSEGTELMLDLLSGSAMPLLQSFTLHCERPRRRGDFMPALAQFLQHRSETMRKVEITLRLPEVPLPWDKYTQPRFPQVLCCPNSTEIIALRQQICDRHTCSTVFSVQIGCVASILDYELSGNAVLAASFSNESDLTELAASLGLEEDLFRRIRTFDEHDYQNISSMYDFGMIFTRSH